MISYHIKCAAQLFIKKTKKSLATKREEKNLKKKEKFKIRFGATYLAFALKELDYYKKPGGKDPMPPAACSPGYCSR